MSVLDPAPLRLKGKFEPCFSPTTSRRRRASFRSFGAEQSDFRRAVLNPTFDRGEGRRQGARPVPCSLKLWGLDLNN